MIIRTKSWLEDRGLKLFKCNQKGQPGDNKNEFMARGQRTQTSNGEN